MGIWRFLFLCRYITIVFMFCSVNQDTDQCYDENTELMFSTSNVSEVCDIK